MKAALTTILTTVIAGLVLWYVKDIYFAPPDTGGDSGSGQQDLVPAALFDRLMAAVIPPVSGGNPLADGRVQSAVRNYLAPTGTGAADTKRLLVEAGYPDGIALAVSRIQFEGGDAALGDLRRRLSQVGIELDIR